MQRGLPFSIIVHIVAIVVVFVFGNSVNRPAIQEPRTLDLEFSMVTLPLEEPIEEPVVEQEPEPPVPASEPEIEEEPVVVPEKPKDIPVEKVPEKKPEPVKKPEVETEAPKVDKPVEKEPEPIKPALTGFGVSGTDVDFPFAWYKGIIKERMSNNNFKPPQMDFRDTSVISCVIHFNIDRSGNITQVTVEQSSGINVYDREALRAVYAINPLPPLPQSFRSSSLGITFAFNQEPGL